MIPLRIISFTVGFSLVRKPSHERFFWKRHLASSTRDTHSSSTPPQAHEKVIGVDVTGECSARLTISLSWRMQRLTTRQMKNC